MTRRAGSGQQAAVDAGTVNPAWRSGTPAALHEGAFVYRSALGWTDDMSVWAGVLTGLTPPRRLS